MDNIPNPPGNAPRPPRISAREVQSFRTQASYGPVPTPAERVRDARRRAGMSQIDLARLAGVTQSLVAMIESGRGNPVTAMRLLEVMGAPASPAQPRPVLRPEHRRLPAFTELTRERIALLTEDPVAFCLALSLICRVQRKR